MHAVFAEVRQATVELLKRATLADLIEREDRLNSLARRRGRN
jgi:DNA-binding IscR family transcriptional regulator